jgi:hypothetical protein
LVPQDGLVELIRGERGLQVAAALVEVPDDPSEILGVVPGLK